MEGRNSTSVWRRLSIVLGCVPVFVPDSEYVREFEAIQSAERDKCGVHSSTIEVPQRTVGQALQQRGLLTPPPQAAPINNSAPPTEHVQGTCAQTPSVQLRYAAIVKDIGDGTHSSHTPLTRRAPRRHSTLISIDEAHGTPGDGSCRLREHANQGPDRTEDCLFHMQGTRHELGQVESGCTIRSRSVGGRSRAMGTPRTVLTDPFETIRRMRLDERRVSCPGGGGGGACSGGSSRRRPSSGGGAKPHITLELADGCAVRAGSECCCPGNRGHVRPAMYPPTGAAAVGGPAVAAGEPAGGSAAPSPARCRSQRYGRTDAGGPQGHLACAAACTQREERNERAACVLSSGIATCSHSPLSKGQASEVAEDDERGRFSRVPATHGAAAVDAPFMVGSPFTTCSHVAAPMPFSGLKGPPTDMRSTSQSAFDFTQYYERSSAPAEARMWVTRSASHSVSNAAHGAAFWRPARSHGVNSSSNPATTPSPRGQETTVFARQGSSVIPSPSPSPSPSPYMRAVSHGSVHHLHVPLMSTVMLAARRSAVAAAVGARGSSGGTAPAHMESCGPRGELVVRLGSVLGAPSWDAMGTRTGTSELLTTR